MGENTNFSNNIDIDNILELSDKDTIVFQTACEYAVTYGSSLMYMADIWKKLEKKGITEQEVHDSLDALHNLGFINKTMSYFNDKFYFVFFITSAGFEKYVRKHYPDFNSTISKVSEYVHTSYENGNKDNLKSEFIATTLKQPKMLINHILEKLHNQGSIRLIQADRGNWLVSKVLI